MAGKKEISRRPVKGLKRRSAVYIVCEGEETEVNYFKRFRRRHSIVDVIPLVSKYKAADSLVEKALTVIRRSEYDPREGDSVWCVFDRDDNTDAMLSSAERTAEAENLRLAFSNPSFEFWFILHFFDHTGPIRDPREAVRILRSRGGIEKYEKNGDYFDKLLPLQSTAVERARKILKQAEKDGRKVLSRASNPVTTVSELVTFLNEH